MEGMSPAQWLATKELVKDDGEMVFEDGISRFCPKHSKILKSAVEGTYPRWFLGVVFILSAVLWGGLFCLSMCCW
jgi:hypothetical protein